MLHWGMSGDTLEIYDNGDLVMRFSPDDANEAEAFAILLATSEELELTDEDEAYSVFIDTTRERYGILKDICEVMLRSERMT